MITRRQKQILGLLAQGMTTEQVAARLELSPQTIKNHLGAAYRTLGATNRLQAFVRLGWLKPPEIL